MARPQSYQRATSALQLLSEAENDRHGATANMIAAAQVHALLAIAAAITEHPVVAGEAERAVRGEGEAADNASANRGPDRGPSGTPPGMGGPTTGPRDDNAAPLGAITMEELIALHHAFWRLKQAMGKSSWDWDGIEAFLGGTLSFDMSIDRILYILRGEK